MTANTKRKRAPAEKESDDQGKDFVEVIGFEPLLSADDLTGEFNIKLLGNLEEERIHDIWRGEKLRMIRHCHVHAELKDIPICKNCSKSRL